MNIVARVLSLSLSLLALLGSGLRAQEISAQTVGTPAPSTTPAEAENPETCNAPGECCEDPEVDGSYQFTMVLTGSKNAGSGMAACYDSKWKFGNLNRRRFEFWVPNPSGPNEFSPGSITWLPGSYVVVWSTPAGPCADDCVTLPVSIPSYTPGIGFTWSPAANLCICPITQIGGPAPTDGADFAPQGQLPNVADKPLVAQSNSSGAQLWWHNPLNPAVPDSFIEVKHWDGTIARYERMPGVRARQLDAANNEVRQGDAWKLVSTTDPFDNVTTYEYDQKSQLVMVAYPNGLYAHWNWTPVWAGNWSGCSGLEIRHSTSITPPTWSTQTTDAPHADSTFLVFENISGKTHFAGKLIAHFGERCTYVPMPSTTLSGGFACSSQVSLYAS